MKRLVLLGFVLGCACGGDKETKGQGKGGLGIPGVPDCEPVDSFQGAEAEVMPPPIKVDLPVVPSFQLPPPAADGSRSVMELRVGGRKLLETELSVAAKVVWIYDCATALRASDDFRNASDEQIAKAIDQEPDRYCHKPSFRIAADVADHHSRWVEIVEAPRLPSATEKKLLPEQELANTAYWRPVPPLAVGDEVIVTGTWKLESPHGVRDPRGLLVYASLKNVTQGWPK